LAARAPPHAPKRNSQAHQVAIRQPAKPRRDDVCSGSEPASPAGDDRCLLWVGSGQCSHRRWMSPSSRSQSVRLTAPKKSDVKTSQLLWFSPRPPGDLGSRKGHRIKKGSRKQEKEKQEKDTHSPKKTRKGHPLSARKGHPLSEKQEKDTHSPNKKRKEKDTHSKGKKRERKRKKSERKGHPLSRTRKHSPPRFSAVRRRGPRKGTKKGPRKGHPFSAPQEKDTHSPPPTLRSAEMWVSRTSEMWVSRTSPAVPPLSAPPKCGCPVPRCRTSVRTSVSRTSVLPEMWVSRTSVSPYLGVPVPRCPVPRCLYAP
jgi:hypothetical protein